MRSFQRVTLRLQRYQRWAPPTLRFLLSHALPLFLGSVSLTSTRRSRMHTDRPGRDAPQSHGAEGLPTGTTRPVTAGIRRAPCLAVWPHTAGGRFEGGIGMPRVFAVRSALSWCQRGTLRLIAVITQGEVIRTILRHLKYAADPPPIAPVCARHASCDWVASGHDDTRGLVSHVRAVAGVAHLRVCALPAQGTPLRLLPLPPARRGGSWWPAGGAGIPAPRRKRACGLPIRLSTVHRSSLPSLQRPGSTRPAVDGRRLASRTRQASRPPQLRYLQQARRADRSIGGGSRRHAGSGHQG
jgi:hypothetical protein